MGSRIYHVPRTRGVYWVLDAVKVFPQGTGTPLLEANSGDAAYWAVARTGVGTYTLTTVDAYPAVKNKSADITMAVPGNWTVVFGPTTVNANNTRTFTFTTFNAGVAADLAANANNIIEFTFIFRNSGALP